MKKNPKKDETAFETPKFKAVSTGETIDLETLKKIVSCYHERLKKLSEISELTDFFFKEKLEYKGELLAWRGQTNGEVLIALDKSEKMLSKIKDGDWNKENLEKALLPEAEKFHATRDRGYLLWPLRAALTGKQASAGPFEIAEILGKERVLKRIKEAKKLITE